MSGSNGSGGALPSVSAASRRRKSKSEVYLVKGEFIGEDGSNGRTGKETACVAEEDTGNLSNARAVRESPCSPDTFRHGWHPNLTKK